MVSFHHLLYTARPGLVEFVVLYPSEEEPTVVTWGGYSCATLFCFIDSCENVLCVHPRISHLVVLRLLKFIFATVLELSSFLNFLKKTEWLVGKKGTLGIFSFLET